MNTAFAVMKIASVVEACSGTAPSAVADEGVLLRLAEGVVRETAVAHGSVAPERGVLSSPLGMHFPAGEALSPLHEALYLRVLIGESYPNTSSCRTSRLGLSRSLMATVLSHRSRWANWSTSSQKSPPSRSSIRL